MGREQDVRRAAEAGYTRCLIKPAGPPFQLLDAHRGVWADTGSTGRNLVSGGRGVCRGLRGYGSLSRHEGAESESALHLSLKQILAWADTFHKRTGQWPKHTSGPIPEAPGETWGAVHSALYHGGRGLPGGSSLYRVLRRRKEAKRQRERGARR